MGSAVFNLSNYRFVLSDDESSVICVNPDETLKQYCAQLNIELSNGGNTISMAAFKQLREKQLKVDIKRLFVQLKHAIDHVWENFLQHPFNEDEIFWEVDDNFMEVDGIDIPRPNHGIVHTLRVTALTLLASLLFKLHAHPSCQNILDLYNEKKIKFLMLAALFSVVGRKDETGHGTVKEGGQKIYSQYREASAKAFQLYCEKNKNVLGITDSEISYYSFVVDTMGNPSIINEYNEEIAENIAKVKTGDSKDQYDTLFDFSILHIAHCLDLFRCADAERMLDVLKNKHELYDKFLVGDYEDELENLIGTAISLIKKTGDRLLSSYSPAEFTDENRDYNYDLYAITATTPKITIGLIVSELTTKQVSEVSEQELHSRFQTAISNLPHGPRNQTQATKDLQIICNAFLSENTEIECRINLLGEVEILCNKKHFNLSRMLVNFADFEQLCFEDEGFTAYADFLSHDAKFKPELYVNGVSVYPSEEDYKDVDPENEFRNLAYGEKLAITLYASTDFYQLLNKFLRTNAKEDAVYDVFEVDRDFTLIVKELLLTAALATSGLLKLWKLDESKFQINGNQPRETLYRTENPSVYALKRQLLLNQGNTTNIILRQKGFTSTSEDPNLTQDTYTEGEKPTIKLLLTSLTGPIVHPTLDNKISMHEERERLLPPGTEFKYYLHLLDKHEDALYAIPVRTITHESEYAYGSHRLRSIRQELIKFIEMQAAPEEVTSDNAKDIFESYKKLLRAINIKKDEFIFLKDIHKYFNSFFGDDFSFSYNDITKIPNTYHTVFLPVIPREEYPELNLKLLAAADRLGEFLRDALTNKNPPLNIREKIKILLSHIIDIDNQPQGANLISTLFNKSKLTLIDLGHLVKYVDVEEPAQLFKVAMYIFDRLKDCPFSDFVNFLDAMPTSFQREFFKVSICTHHLDLANQIYSHYGWWLSKDPDTRDMIILLMRVALGEKEVRTIEFINQLILLKDGGFELPCALLALSTEDGVFRTDIDEFLPHLLRIIDEGYLTQHLCDHMLKSDNRGLKFVKFMSDLLLYQQKINKIITSNTGLPTQSSSGLFAKMEDPLLSQQHSQAINNLLIYFSGKDIAGSELSLADIDILKNDNEIASVITKYRQADRYLDDLFKQVESLRKIL